MHCHVWLFVGLAFAAVVSSVQSSGVAAEPEKAVAHDVYFALNDNSPAAKEKLVAACEKYLTGHPGEIWFTAGVRAEDFQREVNDKDFDVSLHVVFKDKAAHDQYAKAARHLQFIAENKGNWKKVRVFDSYVPVSQLPR